MQLQLLIHHTTKGLLHNNKDKGSDERVVTEDVDIGCVDNFVKEWVYGENKYTSTLEEGEIQLEGPFSTLIEDLEKVMGENVMTYAETDNTVKG
ncbi:hypothetical protein Tco_0190686 [Tanacetum coccineum]